MDCKLDKINLDTQDPLEATVILVVHPYEKWYNYNKYNATEGDVMEERMLKLILDKLDSIENEQRSTRNEISGIKQELSDFKDYVKDMEENIVLRLTRLEEGQESIKEFMFNAEEAFKIAQKDHEFIENLKKAVGE